MRLFGPLRDDHDLLLIDARGTGPSDLLSCFDDSRPFPATRTTLQRAVELCGKRLGDRAGAYTSAAIADDIEAVRTRLEIGRVDLFGQSYGTYLMQVYAQRHPAAIRSIVLSSA